MKHICSPSQSKQYAVTYIKKHQKWVGNAKPLIVKLAFKQDILFNHHKNVESMLQLIQILLFQGYL